MGSAERFLPVTALILRRDTRGIFYAFMRMVVSHVSRMREHTPPDASHLRRRTPDLPSS